jgi:hypothetical protein
VFAAICAALALVTAFAAIVVATAPADVVMSPVSAGISDAASVPEVKIEAGNAGISAPTSARKFGLAAAPVVGAAATWLAATVAVPESSARFASRTQLPAARSAENAPDVCPVAHW